MARITYSGLVTNIRGSIGGTTFQNNAYGFTVKNKANMVKPNTVNQNLAKLVFSVATKAWGQLTESDRANWNSWAATYPQFAKNNPSSVLSGFAVFTKQYANHLIHNGLSVTPINSPDFTLIPLDTVSFVLHNSGGILTLNTTWVINDESWDVNLYMSRPFGLAQNFSGTSPKFIKATSSADLAINLTTPYINAFGALPPINSVVFIDVQLYNPQNGQVPAKSSQRVVVVA